MTLKFVGPSIERPPMDGPVMDWVNEPPECKMRSVASPKIVVVLPRRMSTPLPMNAKADR
jgi:hypothetical protein